MIDCSCVDGSGQPSPYSNNHTHGCQCTTCAERRVNAGFISAEIGRVRPKEWNDRDYARDDEQRPETD